MYLETKSSIVPSEAKNHTLRVLGDPFGSSGVFSFKGAVNESRTSETDAFEKYFQLCERNVAPRLAATEDTSVGGLSSSSRLKRTCYETQSSLPVVSEPSSFGSSVNEPTIYGTFLATDGSRSEGWEEEDIDICERA
ncbi:hypothetical protein Tco_0816937 [Tanacetum coccineum]